MVEISPSMEELCLHQCTDSALEDLSRYHDDLDTILSKQDGVNPGQNARCPSAILDHVFLGDFQDANSLGQLSELGITHLLNCAGVYTENNRLLFMGSMKSYHQLEARDDEHYDMMTHYKEAEQFIEQARLSGGKVLVYCARGINRSAAICVAYLIAHERMALCDAVQTVSEARGAVLTNPGFRKQLIMFAHQHDRLVSQ